MEQAISGKGRQSAAIILDNWLRGRRKALWISKSDKLIEDAQRDWSALGMERLLVTPLSRFAQGHPITLSEGILFLTYATLRSDDRGDKVSRVRQIVEWLGADFDGVIIFDESHAMQNAAGVASDRGDPAPSQQGRAGLRLQHALPDARVVYVSATGATTVHNLAYAQRLGLWGGEDFPFATRAEFVQAIEAGGVAAMEVLARDLRALGLYTARSLSYDGVEYELVEHALTPEQAAIYDAYAGAFAIIHSHLDAALRAANVTGDSGTLNRQAKSAARSAFESAKQRFFGHLLTSMKTPTLIRSIERDLEQGHAAVVQIVSTGEALMERRLAEIPTEEWADIQVDITPREYVLDYLAHSFPVQLYEPFTDGDGNLSSRPVSRDGQPVNSREALARRQDLIERLAALPPVPGALDQIVQRFGVDLVAEVTGRSRRIIRNGHRFQVESRADAANLAETLAFMDDRKRILVFSDAGGTGRSYHADLTAKNQRLRVHYLLEPGWKADAAIQGLGRTNRTNQAQPPLFRPIATNVKAEKRFLSTIARRLDTLGAITRGQRQTGGQGLFRPEDNLESSYARDALRQLYQLLVLGKIDGCPLSVFEAATGLTLTDEGGLKDVLPPITTFLNRLLALTLDLQGVLFIAFERLLDARIQGAIASGAHDVGLETLRAESFTVTERHSIHVHPRTGAETRLLTIRQRQRNHPRRLEDALEALNDPRARLLVNQRSGRAAVQVPARSVMLDDGEIERRVRLLRPMEVATLPLKAMAETHWVDADQETFAAAWTAEVAEVPEFTDSLLRMVTGLLLPVWKRLPAGSTRVYRLQTDDGERIIGRAVPPAWVTGIEAIDATTLPPPDAFAALMEGRTILDLAEGLQLRRVRVMAAHRLELSGFTDAMRERLPGPGAVTQHEALAETHRVGGIVGSRRHPVEGRVHHPRPGEMVGMGLAGIDHGFELGVGQPTVVDQAGRQAWPMGGLGRRHRSHRRRLHQPGGVGLGAGDADRLQAVFLIEGVGEAHALGRGPVDGFVSEIDRFRFIGGGVASRSGGPKADGAAGWGQGLRFEDGTAAGQRQARRQLGRDPAQQDGDVGGDAGGGRKGGRVVGGPLVDDQQAGVDAGAVPGVDRAVDGGGEHHPPAFLQADEGVAPSGRVRCESRAGDRHHPPAIGQPGERRRDVAERGVGLPSGDMDGCREGRVHQHDRGSDVGGQMIVDLGGVEAGDGDLRKQAGEQPGAGLGQFVQGKGSPGDLGEDGQQAGSGGRFQHPVGGGERRRRGHRQPQGDRRRKLLVALAVLGAAGVGGQQPGDPGQQRQCRRRRTGCAQQRRAVFAQKQNRRRFASLVGGLPVPSACGVGTIEGAGQGVAQQGGVDPSALFEMGQEVARRPMDGLGRVGDDGMSGRRGRNGGGKQ